MVIDLLGKCGAHAFHSRQLFDTGLLYAFQSAEMCQQVAATFLTHPFDLFQLRRGARLAAFGTVSGDGETVRFIADLLDQMQGGMGWRQL